MKMEEQDLIALISGYLDNVLAPEETERLLEIVRRDQAAADLMCELSIQHVQLRRIFKRDAATVTRRDFAAASLSGRFRPALRPLALAAGLVIIVAAGFWLAVFLRERDARRPVSIVSFTAGQTERVKPVSVGMPLVAPAGTVQLLRFQDGTIFQLLPGTTAQIVDAGSETSGKTIKLTAGTVIAGVTRQPNDFPLKVTTPHLEVIVVGTRFTCKAEADHTHVRMHQGWAHILHILRGEKLKLEAGQHVTAGERFPFRARAIHEGEH